MILKSYFDGGNQADSLQYDRITLATVCGMSEQWGNFAPAWNRVLGKHKAEFLHTTDAVSLNKEFAKKNGWEKTSVDAFIDDCVGVIERGITRGLFPVTLTIRLDDFLRARQTNPELLPNTVEDICATESLSFCFKRGRVTGAESYQLYFDQGEPFYGHIYDRLHNKKSKRDIAFMQKIGHLGESDMRLVPALQVADLFAWCSNHHDNVSRDWHRRLNALRWQSLFLDYDLLIKPMPKAIEMSRSWNLPRRRPTL